jgi:acyl-CoA thioesterase I
MRYVCRVRVVPILAIAGSLLLAAQTPLLAFEPAPNTPARANTNPAAARPLLVCFGDSLTAGAGVDPDQAYPAYLQQRLDQAGFKYHVVNAGVSGNTTKDGLERITQVLEQHPQVVVVEFGGNDGLRGVPVSEAQRNLDTIVRRLKNSGAKVALAGITLPPQYGGEYIRSFNAIFPAIASKYRVPLLPFVLQDVYGVPGDIQEDGIHATAQGNKQVAINVERLVTPLLGSKRKS